MCEDILFFIRVDYVFIVWPTYWQNWLYPVWWWGTLRVYRFTL